MFFIDARVFVYASEPEKEEERERESLLTIGCACFTFVYFILFYYSHFIHRAKSNTHKYYTKKNTNGFYYCRHNDQSILFRWCSAKAKIGVMALVHT